MVDNIKVTKKKKPSPCHNVAMWFLISSVQCHIQQYFSYIMAGSFIGGGNQSTWKKTPNGYKSLTNLIT